MPKRKQYPVIKTFRSSFDLWRSIKAYAVSRAVSEGEALRQLVEVGLKSVPFIGEGKRKP